MDSASIIEKLLPATVELRHRLHRIPELGYEEFKTAAAIREELTRLGIKYLLVESAPTATVAHIGDLSKPCVALRADIDALPIVEQTNLPYASTHDGRMHACGHDGHTATLLGVAAALKTIEATLPVCVKLFWQPAEEGGAGGRRFWQLGRAIREIIDSYPSDKRIAAIGTGHLSLELGGPRQFGEHGPDPEFDRQAVDWLASGDIDAILANVTHESMAKSGNATHGFMDLILMLGIAGPEKADYVDYLDLFHTMEAYFTWYPEGVAA